MEIISDGNECRRILRTAGGVKWEYIKIERVYFVVAVLVSSDICSVYMHIHLLLNKTVNKKSIISKRSEFIYIMEFKYRSEEKQVNIKTVTLAWM